MFRVVAALVTWFACVAHGRRIQQSPTKGFLNEDVADESSLAFQGSGRPSQKEQQKRHAISTMEVFSESTSNPKPGVIEERFARERKDGAKLAPTYGVAPDDDEEGCSILPMGDFQGEKPDNVGGEMELKEFENGTETVSELILQADGNVDFGETDGGGGGGNLKYQCGMWQCGDEGFQMIIKRTFYMHAQFQEDPDAMTYQVERFYVGKFNPASKDGASVIQGSLGYYPGLISPNEVGDLNAIKPNDALGTFKIDVSTHDIARVSDDGSGMSGIVRPEQSVADIQGY